MNEWFRRLTVLRPWIAVTITALAISGCGPSEQDRLLEQSARTFFDQEMQEWKNGIFTFAEPDEVKGQGLADYKVVSFKRIPGGNNFDVTAEVRLKSASEPMRYRYLVTPKLLGKVGTDWELGPPEKQ
jgi:hypothetical protein